MNTKIWIDTAEVAKIIRNELKANFPGYKFAVRSNRYSGGSSIDVKWIDGPTQEAVNKVIGKYHGASFDGMIDLKSYHDTEYNGQHVHFGNDYLFCNRDYSDAALESAVNWYQSTWGDGDKVQFIPTRQNGKWTIMAHFIAPYEIERRIWKHLQEQSLN